MRYAAGMTGPPARKPESPRVLLVTHPDVDTARSIARQLVEEQLLACANVIPGVTSIYRWQGEVQEDGEVLMVAKTLAGHLHELEQRLLELHPYDTPQFVVLDVDHVEQRYLDWLVGSATRGGSVSDG